MSTVSHSETETQLMGGLPALCRGGPREAAFPGSWQASRCASASGEPPEGPQWSRAPSGAGTPGAGPSWSRAPLGQGSWWWQQRFQKFPGEEGLEAALLPNPGPWASQDWGPWAEKALGRGQARGAGRQVLGFSKADEGPGALQGRSCGLAAELGFELTFACHLHHHEFPVCSAVGKPAAAWPLGSETAGV